MFTNFVIMDACAKETANKDSKYAIDTFNLNISDRYEHPLFIVTVSEILY